jgi:hypothetical protein
MNTVDGGDPTHGQAEVVALQDKFTGIKRRKQCSEARWFITPGFYKGKAARRPRFRFLSRTPTQPKIAQRVRNGSY